MKNIILDSNLFRVSGRVSQIENIYYLGYSGAFVEFETDSKIVKVDIVTDKELQDETLLGRAAIFIDNKETPEVLEILDEYKKNYSITLDGLKHTVRIEKISEAAFGLVGVSAIEIEDDANINPTKKKEKLIEFIGDSITCGYGVEAESELITFKTSEENAEKAYAIKTARALGADYQLISWSGIGIITNWVPEDVNEPLEEILMPELYFHTDKRLRERLNLEEEMYDFSKSRRPKLIVINLGTNDDSYVRCIPEREAVFEKNYLKFLGKVHAVNPESKILCILGTMGQNLCDAVARSVDAFKENNPDVIIEAYKMPEQDKENDGMGADFHPNIISQQKASDILLKKLTEMGI